MKKSIVLWLLTAVSLFMISGCDAPDLYFEKEEYNVSRSGGPLTIKIYTTGICGVDIDFKGAEPWIKVLDYDTQTPSPETSEADVQTRAIPSYEGYIKLDILENNTGKTRKAVLWASTNGICPPVDIIQGC